MKFCLDGSWQRFEAPNCKELNVVAHEICELTSQIDAQQSPEPLDLMARPLPILHRECIERQRLQTEAGAGLDDCSNGIDTCFVAKNSRDVALSRPTSISV